MNFDFDGAQQKLRECETVSLLINPFGVVADALQHVKCPFLIVKHTSELLKLLTKTIVKKKKNCVIIFNKIDNYKEVYHFQVLVNDFFLVACLDDFIENARLFIFETFCRIHQCISIRCVKPK